ncbi:MAG: transporter substrate-binding domain-containing protein [Desulfobacterales bacterium]|nr:transporter substrate-binding domain-containing protein [Desulfobacterales bacterium]
MRKIFATLRLGTFVIALLFYLSVLSPCLGNEEYKIGWEDWAPFQYRDDQGKVTGLDIDLISMIMDRGNLTIKFIEAPWKRHLYEVEKGRIHLAGAASKMPEREKYAYFSDPYRTESVVVYIRKGEADKHRSFKRLKDLRSIDFQLGAVNEYYYGETFSELMKDKAFQAKVQFVYKDELNIKKLMAGRIDGLFMEPVVATSKFRALNLLDKVEVLPVFVYEDDIYVMFSKKSVSPNIVEAFNKSLKRIRSNGEYDRILGKYIIRGPSL